MGLVSYLDHLLTFTLNYMEVSQITFIKLWVFAALPWATLKVLEGIIAQRSIQLLVAWGIIGAIVTFEFFDVMISETGSVIQFVIFGGLMYVLGIIMQIRRTMIVKKMVEERMNASTATA
jgi:hypothetical protein